ncbi:MAG: multidrug efflux RND transporter permease subunit [Elusimicrobia bacterium]|nr:multidrug efflux RND transporter permease subunit [Elusimicrobiota bacterium]
MFSKFFIERPIFATVISLFILLAGIVSILNLPIAQYPELTPPSIAVKAQYPGASAEVISESVAAPLEQKINGVDNMIYMNSVSSSNGDMNLTVYFDIGTDADQAMINVNNRVQSAQSSLPEDVRKYGVTVDKKSSSILQIISITSPNSTYDTTYMGNYALVNVVDDLKRISGVGDAQVMTANDYSMRIWLKPDVMAKLGVTPADVAAAVQEQNAQRAAGKVGQPPLNIKVDRVYSIEVEGRLKTPQEFGNIILRANADGTSLKLKDVADIELGSQTYEFVANQNGKPAVPIGVYLSPGANAVATAKAVDAKMAELAANFPPDMSYNVPYDTTSFVKVSIEEVIHTLIEAMILVFAVVFLFLKDWRATLIPCLAVPVSIVGAFAGMLLFGFSINTLTLFGLVLAIGIVVDDAIIVIENVERIMHEKGVGVKDATIEAMNEVSGPLVAIVLVLSAVFVPVSFMGGMTGAMYQQFAITIAVSVVISGLVALTLTPALTVLIFKKPEHKDTGFFAWFDRKFAALTDKYVSGASFFIKHAAVSLSVFAVAVVLLAVLFKITPTSLVPDEDQGIMMTSVMLDPGSSLDKTESVMTKMESIISQEPQVANTLAFSGFDLISSSMKNNYGAFFITLKDWKERESKELSVNSLIRSIYAAGMKNIPNALVLPFNMPPISGMSTTGGLEGYIQSRGSNATSVDLEQKINKFIAEAQKDPSVQSVTTTFSASVPQLKLMVDTIKAKSMGVSLNNLFATLQATFGTYYVNDFTKFGRSFKVMMQARGDYRAHKEQINGVYVRSDSGDMVPLSALVYFNDIKGADTVERFNLFKSAKVLITPASGYSTGQAMSAMEKAAKDILGTDYTLAWTGSAYQEKLTGSASAMALLLGLVVVFLILSAQYEKWSLPIAVMMAVPFAILGALSGVFIRGLHFLPSALAQKIAYVSSGVFISTLNNDIYFQIALVTLVGLAAKNAILIVEFAVMIKEQGKTAAQAAVEAAKLRFRPIVMTSLAFILGCMPLALAGGAGAASRHSIGTAVVAGMLGATLLAPLFVPFFFVLTSGKEKTEKLQEEKGGENA